MRARLFGGLGLVILAVIGFLVYLSLFVVQQTAASALVLRFGEPVRVVHPGPRSLLSRCRWSTTSKCWRNVFSISIRRPSKSLRRIRSGSLLMRSVGTRSSIRCVFFQSVGTIAVADQRLSVLLNSAVRQVLGEATFEQVVRDERAGLMTRINDRVNREGQGLGVEIVDVRIRRADLPEANSQAIYERMQTEREREAAELRAFGEQAARRIRAEADRAATVIVAEANRESEQIRGDGDAERTSIFALAYGADPEFFDFFRSMQAYQVGLTPDATSMLISPDTEFFRYFNDAFGTSPLSQPGVVTAPEGTDDTATVTPSGDSIEPADSEAAEATGSPATPSTTAEGATSMPAGASDAPDTPAVTQ